MAKIVKIEPIEREYRWHGKGDAEFNPRPVRILPIVDPNTMRYITGLSDEDRQKLKKMGVKEDLSDDFSKFESHPFWDSPKSVIELPFKTFTLNLDNPYDYIKYKVIMAHPSVANSIEDYKKGLFPQASHFIVNNEEVNKEKAKILSLKPKIYAKLPKMAASEKLRVILLVGGMNLKGASLEEIDIMLDNLIDKKTNDVYDVLTQNKDDVAMKYNVMLAIDRGLITKTINNAYKYFDIVLGHSVNEIMNFFKTGDNTSLYEKLVSQLNK